MLFGVAGGMADWLDLDPSLVRLVWALLVVAGGVGLLLYIVATIVIPEQPLGAPAGATAASEQPPRGARRAARAERRGNGAMVFGLLLIVTGAWFLIDRYLNIDSALLFPGLLIVVGGALVVGALARSGGRGPS
jgi:phage shock protein C